MCNARAWPQQFGEFIRGVQASVFFSNERQPEVSLFLFQYPLTLPNLYGLVSLLL